MSGEWDWTFTERARRQFDVLDEYARDRIASKLDEVVEDSWREPTEHLEPLQGAPYEKLRVGPFRLGCRADRSETVLWVLAIRKRGGDAYRGDDDYPESRDGSRERSSLVICPRAAGGSVAPTRRRGAESFERARRSLPRRRRTTADRRRTTSRP